MVPAQHYFMGGVHVDSDSQTTMQHLFAVGETSCNGVHGANRLASNSLLESLVFAKRAAQKIVADRSANVTPFKQEIPVYREAQILVEPHLQREAESVRDRVFARRR